MERCVNSNKTFAFKHILKDQNYVNVSGHKRNERRVKV